MRNILIYSIVGFYFLISIRLTANLHFCKERFISFSIVGLSSPKTCCKGKKMKNGCCKNVHVSLKKSNNDKPTSQIYIPSFDIAEVSKPFTTNLLVSREYIPAEISQTTNSPPKSIFPHIYLKNCVFII